MKKTKIKKRGAQKKNGPVVKSVESVEERLWWKRFVKEVGLRRKWKTSALMDGENGESTEGEDVVEAGKVKSSRFQTPVRPHWRAARHGTSSDVQEAVEDALFYSTF